MDLSKRNWYVAWFFLSLSILDKFWGRNEKKSKETRFEGGTNLCHFMRVTLIWAPLVIIVHLLIYAAAFVVLMILPMRYFGTSQIVSGGISIASVVACIGGAALVVWLAYKLLHFVVRAAVDYRESHPRTVSVDSEPSYLSVVWAYVVATKRRVCPIITFKL